MAGESLRITGGKAVGTRIPLGDEFLIGRAASNDEGRLGDDQELSRYHAKIYRAGDQLTVEDLGSTNGTFLNGEQVTEAQRLRPGDTIKVGTTLLEVLDASGKAPHATQVAAMQPAQPTDQATSVSPAVEDASERRGGVAMDWSTHPSASIRTGGRPRKIPAESERVDVERPGDVPLRLAEPSFIGLRAASGGFNCVVEVAARYCQRMFNAYPAYLRVPIPTAALARSINRLPQLSAWLQGLTLERGPQLELLAGFASSPTALVFEDPHRVHVTYRGGVALVKRDRPERPAGLTALTTPLLTSGLRDALAAGTVRSPDRSLDWIRPDDESITTIVADLGPLTLDVRCEYVGRPDPASAACNVRARLAGADVTLSPPGADARLLLDEFVGSTADTQLKQLGSLEPDLTPKVSVVGQNWEPVPEFPDCEVRVFHVGEPDDQAMVVAFDLMPGCHGVIENVQQFLCGSDYGVISDEWVVERVLKNKWRHGGFARSLFQGQPVRIKRGDREEDASVELHVSLDDLSVVAVECDANTATDYIRLGGPATATPLRLRLQDGTVLRADEVDLGGEAAVNWTVFTDPKLNPRLSSNAQMRWWQETAHRDGYLHLARPFARIYEPSMPIDYARVEGAIRHVFFLGSINIIFA